MGKNGISVHLFVSWPPDAFFGKNNILLKNFCKKFWLLKKLYYLCIRVDKQTQPTRRVPGLKRKSYDNLQIQQCNG